MACVGLVVFNEINLILACQNSRIPGGEFGHNDFYPVVMAAAQANLMVKCGKIALVIAHKLKRQTNNLLAGQMC